jgi:hypothetical protein
MGQKLLAAVTTISPTIRYISLRAWIARQYALARLPKSWKSFKEFAGKVEAAVAIGNLLVDRRTPGLVGPVEGLRRIDSGDDPIKLEPLVKQLAVAAYGGPSDALNISFWDEDLEVPGLSAERGVQIAESVHAVVKNTHFVREIIGNPSASTFNRSALQEFGAAFPINRPVGRERHILISCLFPKNEEAGGAFTTYRLLIELAQKSSRKPTEDDVFQVATNWNQSMPKLFNACLDGWLWYLVRDMIAACHEAVLQVIVDVLPPAESGKSIDADSVLNGLVVQDRELELALRDFGLLPKGKLPLDQPLSTLAEMVRKLTEPKTGSPSRWKGRLQEHEVAKAALVAGAGTLVLLPVAWLLARERVGDVAQLQEDVRNALSYQGASRLGIVEVIFPALQDMLRRRISIREAAYELALKTVNHHLNVAWARLRSDPRRDVSVVMVQERSWLKNNTFVSGRTASRIVQTTGWLTQLGLIDDQGCTEDGATLRNGGGLSEAAGAAT